MALTLTEIHTRDELVAVPIRDRVVATWEPGTPNFQAPYLAFRSGQPHDGASAHGYGILNETHFAQMITWGARLVHLPSVDGDVVTDREALMALPLGTVVTLTWEQPLDPHASIPPYTAVRAGGATDVGAASGRIAVMNDHDWARLLDWDAIRVQVTGLPA